MKKRIFAGVMASAAALTAVSLTGCDSAASPEETLTIMSWSGNSDTQVMIDFFCEQTGTDKSLVKWAQVGTDGAGARDGYGTYLDGSQDGDIIICDAEWAPNYINSNYTVDLSEIGISKGNYPNAYAYTLALGTSDDGKFKGATFQATPGGFVYNVKTAEEKLGVKSAAEMQAMVSDWNKFEETAATLAAQGVAICATEGGLWQIMQCQRDSQWVVDGKLVVDSFATDFIQKAKDYVDKGYLTKEEQWTDAWYATIQNGQALGDFAPTWGLTNVGGGSIAENFAGGKDVEGTLGFCAGPAAWFWGGSYMCVTNKCNTNDLAKLWMETFTINADSMEAYARKTGDFVNHQTVMEKLSKDTSLTNKLFQGGAHQFPVLFSSASNINLSATKYDSVIKNAFNQAVQGYAIKGETSSVEAAVEAFKNEVGKTYADIV
ncbi:MAG: carbohydrate ABC transporter substrate-binding protein [Oscillospiraceae bacterium]|nr:carbohydrate ABC transporter substrate-binding protein [Oscillospiraceae bacterium]